MGLASSDLLLVERSNTVYKETFGNRANIDDTDLILVERSNTLYKCAWSDWDDDGGGGGGGSATGTHQWNASNTSYDIDVFHTQGSGDSTMSYRFLNRSMTVTGGDGADSGNLYIGLRIRGSTAYYHDFCIAHVQVVTSTGSAFRTDSTYTSGYDWSMHNSGATNGRGGFHRCTSSLASQTYSVDPSTLSYGSISTAANNYWSYGSSTGSTYTGAADGTYSPSGLSGGGGSILTGFTSQASSTNFIYTETSGSGYTIGTTTMWLRGPTMTIHNGDQLRIAYLAVGGSNSSNGLGYRDDDVLYFRFK